MKQTSPTENVFVLKIKFYFQAFLIIFLSPIVQEKRKKKSITD